MASFGTCDRPRLWGSLAFGAALALCQAAPVQAQPAVVAVVLSGIALDDPAAADLLKAAEDAVEADPQRRLLARTRNQFLFASPAPKDRSEARRDAKKCLVQAQDRLQNFNVEGAKDALARATVLLKPDLGVAGARPLNQLRLALAVAVGHAERDEKTIASALRQYATRFGTAAPAPGLWPPDIERRLQTVVARSQTKLRLTSLPPGEAFVDGRPVGLTPLTVSGLAPGRHRIEVRAPDHYPVFAWAKSSSTKLGQAHIELAPSVGARVRQLPARGPVPEGLRNALAVAARRGPATLVAIISPTADKKVSVRLLDARDLAVYGPVVADSVKSGLAQVSAGWVQNAIAKPAFSTAPWALGAAGAGLLAAGAGIGVRLWAKDTQSPLQTRQGALTQREAFGIQEQAEGRALLGTLLISGGVALVTGAAGLFTWDLLTEAQP